VKQIFSDRVKVVFLRAIPNNQGAEGEGEGDLVLDKVPMDSLGPGWHPIHSIAFGSGSGAPLTKTWFGRGMQFSHFFLFVSFLFSFFVSYTQETERK